MNQISLKAMFILNLRISPESGYFGEFRAFLRSTATPNINSWRCKTNWDLCSDGHSIGINVGLIESELRASEIGSGRVFISLPPVTSTYVRLQKSSKSYFVIILIFFVCMELFV